MTSKSMVSGVPADRLPLALRLPRRLRVLGVILLLAASLLPRTFVRAEPVPVLSIDDITVTEGQSAVFTVSLAGSSAIPVSVDFFAADGTAVGGDDFRSESGTLTFAPGETTQTITIVVNSDGVNEGQETFLVNLLNAVGATFGDAEGVGTVLDNDVLPSLSVDDVVVPEERDAAFTVSLSPASGQSVTVEFTTANGTAAAPEDYDSTAGLLTFAPGEVTQTINVPVNVNQVDDAPEETFTVRLANATNGQIVDSVGQATIEDRNVTPSVSIDDVRVTEDDSGSRDAVFTVSLFPASGQAVTVAYTTANGTATAPDDYEDRADLLVFSRGETTKKIQVPVKGDKISETAQETFTVLLSNATNAQIVDTVGQGTIQDNDIMPSLTINDVRVVEGNDGTTAAVFTVTLFPDPVEPVIVEYATANATATSPEDYRDAAGLLTFSPGEETKEVVVRVTADTVDEVLTGVGTDSVVALEETFTVNLFNPVNARIADATGVATIVDDDSTPVITIDDVAVSEGNDGHTTDAVFTVSVFPESREEVTVDFATLNQSAVASDDYDSTDGTLTFRPGERTKTITVEVVGDDFDEGREAFAVMLSNPRNAIIFDDRGIGTITNDDLVPSLSINDVTVMEGNAGLTDAVFTVSLSRPSNQIVTFDVLTANDSAASPDDYLAVSGTLSIAPGQTSVAVRIPVVGDALEEPDETFLVRLSRTDAALADPDGVGVVVDDDTPAGPRVALTPTPTGKGYWLAASDGDIFVFGDAPFLGSFSSVNRRCCAVTRPNQPMVGMAANSAGRGYWLVGSDGGVFAFGNAGFLGSTGGIRLNQPIVGMTATPSGLGYWLVASDGGIFAFGDAGFFGSAGAFPLSRPIVGMTATSTGRGYWLVASDGGVFAFGDARFLGSMGGRPLNRPIVGMAATLTGRGYWLVASDGGIFAYGDATFLGSTGGLHLRRPVVGMAAASESRGYWLVADDGGVFALGEAPFLGSTGGAGI
jgi:hypothetical protein